MAYDAWQGATPPEFVPAVPKPDDKSGQQRRSAYYENPKRLYVGVLSGSDAALYTAPSAPTSGPPPKVRVTEIIVNNTDTSSRTVTLRIRTGAVSGTTQEIMSAATVAANSVSVFTLNTIMEAAEVLSGLASAADKVNVRISGIEYLTLPTA